MIWLIEVMIDILLDQNLIKNYESRYDNLIPINVLNYWTKICIATR